MQIFNIAIYYPSLLSCSRHLKILPLIEKKVLVFNGDVSS